MNIKKFFKEDFHKKDNVEKYSEIFYKWALLKKQDKEVKKYLDIINIIKNESSENNNEFMFSFYYGVLEWINIQKVSKNTKRSLLFLYVYYRLNELNIISDYKTYIDILKYSKFFRSFVTSNHSINDFTENLVKYNYITELDKKFWKINFIEDETFKQYENQGRFCETNFLEFFNNRDILLWNYKKYIFCKRCGKIIKKITNRKYCEDCAKLEKNHIVPKEKQVKKVICIDCGVEFETSSKNNTKHYRCRDCYKKHRRNRKTTTMQQLRLKQEVNNE